MPSDVPNSHGDTSVRVVDRRWWARPSDGVADGADGGRSSDKPAYVEELERRLETKDAELRDTIARYREASAEFEQMRARVRRDTARDAERSRRQMLADLLDVADNLDRAIAAARDGAEMGAVLQGVELVRAQFLAKLESHGVTPFVSLQQPFDPVRHEAATTVPVREPFLEGTVVGIIREGYAIGPDVLRPALVAVGQLQHEGAAS